MWPGKKLAEGWEYWCNERPIFKSGMPIIMGQMAVRLWKRVQGPNLHIGSSVTCFDNNIIE